MSYIEDYKKSLYDAEFYTENSELNLLENKFQNEPSKSLAQELSSRYGKLANMKQGYKKQDTSFATIKSDMYGNISKNFDSYKHANNHQY